MGITPEESRRRAEDLARAAHSIKMEGGQASPEALADAEDPLVDVLGVRPGEVTSAAALVWRLGADHGVTVPDEVRAALEDPSMRSSNDVVQLWRDEPGPRPWEVGDEPQRWAGYLDLEHYDPVQEEAVLRNLVGATTYGDLRKREDDFVLSAVRAAFAGLQDLAHFRVRG